MISTYLGYVSATKDMTSTLAGIAKQATVKSDQQYYDTHIGKVKNVDEFLNDYKLYSYAMKAYGLEDMAYAKAFMKKVLTSDLSNTSSFANKLTDSRYRQFAAAFNFGGTSKNQSAQSDSQKTDTIGLYEQSFANETTLAKKESKFYDTWIDKVSNVDDIVNSSRMTDYILRAHGLSPDNISKTFLKSVLTSDVNDPNSFVNTASNFSSVSVQATYKLIASQFGFNADGTLSGATAQTTQQKEAMISRYDSMVPNLLTPAAATSNDDYYRQAITKVQSLSEITGDNRLFSYIKTAFNLDPKLTPVQFKLVFTNSDYAALTGMTDMVAHFQFASDGTLPAGQPAQTQQAIDDISTKYLTEAKGAKQALFTDAEKHYKTAVGEIKTIADFFAANDIKSKDLPTVEDMALRAFGIGKNEVSRDQLRKILESDPYDSKSYVNSLKDSRFVELAKAYNFDSKGNLRAPVTALSQTSINSLISAYSKSKTFGLTGEMRDKAVKDAKDAATDFSKSIVKIKTVDDLLADKKLTEFILVANNIDPKSVDKATLKKAFTADPEDAKGFLNTQAGQRFKAMVNVFNFDAKGNLTTAKIETGQNKGARLTTNDLYLHQTLESQQGDSNEGVRLALYFQRKAPQVNSVYDIMSDPALYNVIKTTYSLPASMSNMDVTRQAAMLEKLFPVKDLHDAGKVDKLLKRFSAVFDAANGGSTASAASAILTRGAGIGMSADLMLSIAQLKSR
ncbi:MULTISPECIES: DUF1217 domain-containing protein [Rhizobium]|uniref:DUF1217 domain-containing protein n=1 Tax=Rhizobium tropici TaxID=398 RepID=A0A6P1CEZ4_RHITR|nr:MULTISPECIES: DUF1217 domain-containing protein [Rhizobium]AGB75317.1 hypothetical protein RTCIAT899_PC07645 [Rhizobium tropici CIAT 899]MBB4241691.1 hypothetical protein [Rhizobium tropici]MBB5593662.1 hypothetical protein [Rhizobium tropici]MBB6492016.1 hypothetical protein [Rhizobium tropici]NEV13384.1 DUF1217 domain-containing protein [Rhizobium tropici]